MPQPREHERLLAKPRHDVRTAFQQLFHSHHRALPRRARNTSANPPTAIRSNRRRSDGRISHSPME